MSWHVALLNHQCSLTLCDLDPIYLIAALRRGILHLYDMSPLSVTKNCEIHYLYIHFIIFICNIFCITYVKCNWYQYTCFLIIFKQKLFDSILFDWGANFLITFLLRSGELFDSILIERFPNKHIRVNFLLFSGQNYWNNNKI